MDSQFSTYFDEGGIAYSANRHREAALLFARAKEVARLNNEQAQAFKAGFWEACAWQQSGGNRRAYALLFALLADASEDAPVYERFLAEKVSYQLWRDLGRRTRTERATRLKRLEVLEASQQKGASCDLAKFWGGLARDAADWAEALCRFEEAWTLHDSKSFLKSCIALDVLDVLLRLGRYREAARWLDLLEKTDQESATGRLCFHQGQALLALFRSQDRDKLDAARRALEDDLAGTQHMDNAVVRHTVARLWLLLRNKYDPNDRFHPTRHLLRQKPETGRDWDRLLVLADFRLAAVRHAAGMPPCDDYYYNQLQALPNLVTPPNPNSFIHCVKRTRLAIAHLRQAAIVLDRLYECTWYCEEARAREKRLEEIANSVEEAVYGQAIS